MPTRLLLISHAATAAMRSGRFPADDALNTLDERALIAAAALRRRLPAMEGEATAFCSPALCARETAQALGLAAQLSEPLADMDYGRWRGLRLAEVGAAEPAALAAWSSDPVAEPAPHGGESFNAVLARVGAWLDMLGDADSAVGSPVTGSVIAVTHAPVVRAAIVHAIGAVPQTFSRIEVAPLSVVELRHSKRGWTWWPAQS
ncbi:MAG TPA: histidine phosphatase family protein [Herbaspirillum sp.]|jgi:broad specificity phosphatase PhoE